jgi:uncharacterized RDD family membrane protein YckC
MPNPIYDAEVELPIRPFETQPMRFSVRNDNAVTDAKNVVYAGFWRRLLAMVIDVLLSQAAYFFVAFPIGFSMGASMAGHATQAEIASAGQGLGLVLSVLFQWLWFTIPESSYWQGSVGKRLLGLKVTDKFGHRISFGRANGRYWGKVVSGLFFGIGFLMIGFTEKKQGLHDRLAGSLVVIGRT